MKKLVALLLAAACIFSLIGCDAGGAEGTSDAAADTVTQFVIGMDPDYNTFDPAQAYEGWAAPVMIAMYDTLFRFEGSEAEPVPYLVKDYTINETGTQITMTLRDDVVFSSGNKMTSADVKFSLDRMKNLQGTPSFLVSDFAEVETPDDYTVILNLAQPDGALTYKLAGYYFGIVDSKVVIEHGGISDETAATADTATTWLTNNSAGSGPYIMESYTPDNEVVLVRNDNYWNGPAYAQRVIFKDIPDPTTQSMMVQVGDLDVALGLNADQAAVLASAEGVEVENTGTLNMLFLMMNNDPEIGGPMANPLVQKAVRYAVNYKGIQEMCGPGSVTPQTIIQVGFYGALEARDPEYTDVAKAKELLAEAGYPDGFTVKFSVITNSTEGYKWLDIAQKVQADLAAVGINAEIETMDSTVGYELYRGGKMAFAINAWGPDYLDSNNQLAFLPGKTVGLRAQWKESDNPELAALGDKALAEMDNEVRKGILEEIQTTMADDSPWLPLVQVGKATAFRSDVKGADYSLAYMIDVYNMSK